MSVSWLNTIYAVCLIVAFSWKLWSFDNILGGLFQSCNLFHFLPKYIFDIFDDFHFLPKQKIIRWNNIRRTFNQKIERWLDLHSP